MEDLETKNPTDNAGECHENPAMTRKEVSATGISEADESKTQ